MGRKNILNYNMYEAKTRFSEIVEKARGGAEVVLMNRGKPVAKIIPFWVEKKPRKLGFAKDIKMLEGFEDVPDAFEDYLP